VTPPKHRRRYRTIPTDVNRTAVTDPVCVQKLNDVYSRIWWTSDLVISVYTLCVKLSFRNLVEDKLRRYTAAEQKVGEESGDGLVSRQSWLATAC